MSTPVQTDVRDYHQGLAQHLLDLIRKTTSAAAASTRKASPNSVTPPAPGNPRQHSDSSLESDSRVSSGETTESRKSRRQSQSDEVTQEDEDVGRRGSGSSLGEFRNHQSGGSLSQRNDLTARPDNHPSRFPSLSPRATNDDAHPTAMAETSATGAQRYAAHSPSSASASSSPNRRSGRARHITVPSSQTELHTREAEHRKAWETDGRRVWRNIPEGFELKLEKKKPRSGSNESVGARSASIHSGLSGAGPGTAIRPDDVFVAEVADIDARDLERISSSNPTNQESTLSEVSKADAAEVTALSESSVSPSMAKPTIKRTSTLQRRQARMEAEAEAEVAAVATPAPVGPAAHDEHEIDVDDKASESIPAMSEDEQEEYIRKRELRLRKKEYVLKKRVGAWWQGVKESGLHDTQTTDIPEIDPHIPSPTKELDSSMLRFPPLPASMPDFIGGDSPTLRLPSLQLLEDGRKNRSSTLSFDGLAPKGESDVDLLIRLTEMSRVSSSASGTGRARFPSAPPHSITHSHTHTLGSGIVTGPAVSQGHNLRVKDNKPTPKPKPQQAASRAVFSGFGTLDRFPPI